MNFTVNDGDTLSSVSGRLADQNIIKSSSIFRWYASTRGGIDLVPGYYTLRAGDNAGAIIKALSTPPAQTFVSVTFPEGMTLTQMADRLSSKLTFMSASDFTTAATDGSIRSELQPKDINSLEGLLFPAQYSFATGTPAKDALQSMIDWASKEMQDSGIFLSKEKFTPQQLLITRGV